ncbi:MAG TPA: hypothetical protein VHS96_11555 [Bacteroidia bacterium]|nr:hypothetical protein [Bacteroidia bacterium]
MKARKGSKSDIKKIAHFAVLFSVWMIVFGAWALPAQTTRLYNTTRGTGIVQELDLVTGAVIATNVGGITNGRGMDFSPYGGLFVANGSAVSSVATNASAAVPQLNYAGETPHDLCFDAVGNLYVVTNLNVYVYNPSLGQTLVFAHGIATTTGDGNTEKGWGIEIRPDNGEIYVVGAAGLRRFDPFTGVQIGATVPGSTFGFAGIKFTTSTFGGVYLYVGNVISGVDQIRAYDVNLTFLRSFFAAHVGNPIDLEVNPANGDLYLFNTVVSLPANRFLLNETAAGGFSTTANPTRGSALGSFEPILARNDLRLEAIAEGNSNRLNWTIESADNIASFSIRRNAENAPPIALASIPTQFNRLQYEFWDTNPVHGNQTYQVIALNQNGDVVSNAFASLWSAVEGISFTVKPEIQTVSASAHDPKTKTIRLSLTSATGIKVSALESTNPTCEIDYSALSNGIYIVHAQSFDAAGKLLETKLYKLVVTR